MSNKHSNTDIFAPTPGEGHSFDIRQFINKMFFHWPLFLLFFAIAFILAIFYLKYERPVYDVHAKILIKDQSYQNRRKQDAFQELYLIAPEKDVSAEIGIMGSIPITEQIVTDLQLWVTYQRPTQFYSYADLYKNTPVQFKLLKPGRNFDSDELEITIKSRDYFLLKQGDKKFKRFAFKDSLFNSFGIWKLDTTWNFKNFIGKTIKITLDNPKLVTKYYQDAISEYVGLKATNVVDIDIQDEVPERGRDILDDLIRVYFDSSVQVKRESTQSTLKFVDQRLVAITQELNNVESKYQGYKSSNAITETSSQAGRYLTDVQTNESKVNDINIKLSVLDAIEQYVNSDRGADNPPATLGMDDQSVVGLIRQLSDLQLQKTRLLATLPENNPLFNPINQQISVTKTQLRENIKSLKASLISTKQQLAALGSGYESSIRTIPGQERDLVDIKRMQAIKENLYTYLLEKKEQLSLDYASTIADAMIINHANNGIKQWPIPKAVYAIAFLFGLIVPTSLLFGREAIKNRVLSKGQIVFATGMPVLSEIDQADNNHPIVVLNQNSYIGEQFRDLRTKFNYLHGKNERGKVTLFTSSIAGEGKSFVIGNLAATLSVSGKKVIILELDLRRPTLSSRFKLDKTSLGVTDFLIGNATKAQIIQPLTITDNLFAIASGTVPPNPSELLESDELATLLKELRLEFDHILIDSPPVHLLTDAMILAPMCDLSLYMIRQDYTPKKELGFINEVCREKKLPRVNLIFNGIVREKHGDRYGYQKNSYYIRYPKKFKNEVKRFFTRF
jgi:capsular exopolysaccharide synthesis family protein